MSEKLNTPVGVIGLGNLGLKLAAQATTCDNEVIYFDLKATEPPFEQAVDPAINIDRIDPKKLKRETAESVLRKCSIVHWAVGSEQLGALPPVPPTTTVILHDSVMANSVAAIERRDDDGRFVAAHCLMNKEKRVLVSAEFGDHAAATEHFAHIGLVPKSTTVEQHDKMMAHTQGILALLLEAGVKQELDQAAAEGNLTPSAAELHALVTNRKARWTGQTVRSILDNPRLAIYVQNLVDKLPIDNHNSSK